MIDHFSGKYIYLSNFYLCEVPYLGIRYSSSEAAFQAQKVENWDERERLFTHVNPKEAKQIGRTVKLRPDWEEIKDQVMFDIVQAKFVYNKDLLEKLKETNGEDLMEGNHWGDTYWGVCKGHGKNMLGRILMAMREIAIRGKEDYYINLPRLWEMGYDDYFKFFNTSPLLSNQIYRGTVD